MDNKQTELISDARDPSQTVENQRLAAGESNTASKTTLDDTETKNSENVENWNEVLKKKRGRESPHSSPIKQYKQTKLENWLGNPMRTDQNRFAGLEVDAPATPKEIIHKPPPIFVDNVYNIQPLLTLLNENVPEKYEIKVLNHDRVKIQPKLPEAYSKIVKMLEERNTEFFTYRLKNERNFRVFLRNMHYSVNPEDIKEELKSFGHNAVNIWNMKHRKNKNPLPLFVIELEPKANNREIYDIKGLFHSRVTFEPPRAKKEIPQCSNCQRYGHTKSCCHRKPTCIKCAGEHTSALCSRKTRSNDVKCALCKGNHPANYKGCQVYKTIRGTSHNYPIASGASSTVPVRQQKQPSRTSSSGSAVPNTQSSNQGQSYASVLGGRQKPSTQKTQPATRNNAMPETFIPQETSFASELREMMSIMREMMQQMSAMTTMLVNLTSQFSSKCVTP